MSKMRQRAIENLFFHSKENQQIDLAVKEWEFTGEMVDHLSANNRCQLCEGENLRYHFEIQNATSNSTLWVGSSCITRFDIAVYEDGVELFAEAKEKYLKKKIEEKKQELMLNQLRDLYRAATTDEKEFIEYYVDDFKSRGAFKPDHLLELFHLMKTYAISYESVLYKINLRSGYDMQNLLRLSKDKLELIWDCLSVSQKARYTQKQKERIQSQQVTPSEPAPQTITPAFESYEDIENAEEKELNEIFNSPGSQVPREDIFELPETILCKRCGQYTDDWITNDLCRECAEMLLEEAKARAIPHKHI